MEYKDFLDEFHNEILREVEQTESYSQEEVFLNKSFEYMREANYCANPVEIDFSKDGKYRVDGYSYEDEIEELIVFISNYDIEKTGKKLNKKNIEKDFRFLNRFIEASIQGFKETADESHEVHDLAEMINDKSVKKIRMVVVTNKQAEELVLEPKEFQEKEINFEVWDIRRTYQCHSSEEGSNNIVIDFINEYNEEIKLLELGEKNDKYDAYLFVLPGRVVGELYGRYGQKLIEKNIRAFLQAKNNVNKGIRDTLQKEPEMFMAYNNGLSTTANEIEISEDVTGNKIIKKINDWQIVNGGQTTASIYEAVRKSSDISNVYVQVKLCVIKDRKKENEIVPKISKYANSQTKVNQSDFYANDEYNVNLERFSRKMYVPKIQGVAAHKWFFERVKGQYMVEKSRKKTIREKTDFESEYNRKYKFTKTDMAKYMNSYDQLPHIVSRGAEFNFNNFMNSIEKSPLRGGINEEYYKKLIGRAVLFKECDRIVRKLEFGGYKANIVAYTVAALSYLTDQRINLESLWNFQILSDPLEREVTAMAKTVFKHITDTSQGDRNVTQYCKKEECWKSLKIKINGRKSDMLKILQNDLVAEGKVIKAEDNKFDILAYKKDMWFTLSKWAKENNYLEARARQFLASIGKQAGYKTNFSSKQKYTASKILNEISELGFDISQYKL